MADKARCPKCGKTVPTSLYTPEGLHPHKIAGRASRFCQSTGR